MHVIEILVNVHATRKVPGAVQYSSDEHGGSISLRASLLPGEGIEPVIKYLWNEAETELERRGLTVVKREAEVGFTNQKKAIAPQATAQPPAQPAAPAYDELRYKALCKAIQHALDNREMPKPIYANLIKRLQAAYGKSAKIGDYARVAPVDLLAWAEENKFPGGSA